MKKFLFLFCAVICFISCSNNLPEFTEIKNVYNLNYSYGSYITWDSVSDAEKYNVYTINSDSVNKVLTTANTYAFITAASTEVAVSAIVEGKETYLSSTKKPTNTWWTKVKCEKLETGKYSLSWTKLPIAEDYVLISHYTVTYVMNEYASGVADMKTKSLEEYDHYSISSNLYNAVYGYRKCKSLNTIDNNVIYTDTYFNSGMYSNYVCLFAKIGDDYYQISDFFKMK